MDTIYLDNSATTRLDERVLAAMMPYLTHLYGNPSSLHGFGQQARAAVEKARRQVAALIQADPGAIVFTAGGTEADNLAILGTAAATPGRRRLVGTRIEHSAGRKPLEMLEKEGYELTLLSPCGSGVVNPDHFAAALRPDTALACVMHVNNETGAVQDIQTMAACAHQAGVPFFTDAVQSVGKIPVEVDALGVDLLSLSAHKIHGPKGVGALYIRPGSRLGPVFGGGPQERGRRPGTENVAGIVGLGEACRLLREGAGPVGSGLGDLRDLFEAEVLRRCPWAVSNAREACRAPHIASIAFPGVDGDALVIALDIAGVAASAGSACGSGAIGPSPVLEAMGLTPERVHGTVRFSFSRFNTDREVLLAAERVCATAERIRDSLA